MFIQVIEMDAPSGPLTSNLKDEIRGPSWVVKHNPTASDAEGPEAPKKRTTYMIMNKLRIQRYRMIAVYSAMV